MEMVLGDPKLVESHLVQQRHLLEHAAVKLRLWPVQGGNICRQVVGSKLHTQAFSGARFSVTDACSMDVSDAVCKRTMLSYAPTTLAMTGARVSIHRDETMK
jgi:hypothetical protein